MVLLDTYNEIACPLLETLSRGSLRKRISVVGISVATVIRHILYFNLPHGVRGSARPGLAPRISSVVVILTPFC